MKPKVLFIHHGKGINGSFISMLGIINSLKDRFDFKVGLLNKGTHQRVLNENNIEYEILDCPTSYFYHNETGKIQWRYALKYLKIYRDWKRTVKHSAPQYLKNQNADIVHLNSHVLSSWAVAATNLGLKVILHNRETVAKGYFGFRYKILKNILENNTSSIINISEDNKKRLGILENSYVVHNYVNIPKEYRASMSCEGVKKVLYLGGQAKIKGFETAVDALKFLNDDIVVRFAGNYGSLSVSSSVTQRIKNRLKLILYPNSYRPLNKLSKMKNALKLGLLLDPYPEIDNCDILISPFTIEHFSRPAIEAMAYGKPVIGSNVEGMDEIIDKDVTGLLVEKNNPKKLAEAINYLCENPSIAQLMGHKGREKAKRLFSSKTNSSKIEQIYLNVLKNNIE